MNQRMFGAAAVLAALLACGDHEDVTHVEAVFVPGVSETTPIVFRSGTKTGVGDLFVMSADGGDLRPLTQGGDYYFPKWSPNGKQLAFRRADRSSPELAVMDVDKSLLVQLTDGESPFALLPPDWSKDGEHIAFASATSDELHVWAMPVGGGTPRRLLPTVVGGEDAASWAWSEPARLAFTGPLSDSPEIWIVGVDQTGGPPPDSTDYVNLTESRVFAPSFPRWSPDGSRIAFQAYAREAEQAETDELAASEGEPLQLPDTEIFTIDVQSHELTRVTDNPANDRTPVWAPDGQSLLISSDRDGDFDLWLVPLDAPESAYNLTDDADDPQQEEAPDWYWSPE